MPKLDLAAQISSMQYNETDSEDFDEIIENRDRNRLMSIHKKI